MLEEYRDIPLFRTRIPRSVKVGEAALYGQTICEYAPSHPAALAYESLTKILKAVDIVIPSLAQIAAISAFTSESMRDIMLVSILSSPCTTIIVQSQTYFFNPQN